MIHSPSLDLLPAVDVVDGRALRVRGEDVTADVVHGDPVDAALMWEHSGARWIHLVDIDAAFERGSNAEALSRVIDAVNVKVEVSGGIRDEESLKRALDMGCDRVNIGTEAVGNPSWLAKALETHGNKLAVCLDVRGRTLAARGQNEDSGDLWQVLDRLEGEGCARFVVTDVTRDGAMAGVNLALLREVCSRTKRPVIASGGISSLRDIVNLRCLVSQGLEGAIVGKALYANAFTLEQALYVAGKP